MSARLMVLGATTEQLPLVRRARALGHHVTVVDNDAANPCHAVSNRSVVHDLRDLEGLIASVLAAEPDGVMTMASEVAVPAVSHLRTVFGLPEPIPPALAGMCDKLGLVHLLESSGLPFAPTSVDDDDAPPGPWVVKPARASGGRGLSLVSDQRLLAAARARAAAASLDGRPVVQSLVDGVHLSVEGAVTPQASGLVITKRLVSEHPHATTLGHVAPASLAPAESKAVRAVVEALFRSSGHYAGPVNADVVLQRDGAPVVIDASPRLGGNRLPMLAEEITGWPLVSWAIGRALGHAQEPAQVEARAYAAVGVLGAVECGPFTWNERARPPLMSDPAVVDLSITAELGEVTRGLTDSTGRVGYVMVRNSSESALVADIVRLRPLLAEARLAAPGFTA